MDDYCTITTNTQSRSFTDRNGYILRSINTGASKATTLKCNEHSLGGHDQHAEELMSMPYLVQSSSMFRRLKRGRGAYFRIAITEALYVECTTVAIALHSLMPWRSMDTTSRPVRSTAKHACGIIKKKHFISMHETCTMSFRGR